MVDNIHIILLVILLINLILTLSLVFKNKENMKNIKPPKRIKSNQ